MMRLHSTGRSISVLTVLASFAAPALAQDSYTFNRAIDAIDWPRAQIARQSQPIGLNGSPFHTNHFSFSNFSGNPAFYDANNLLTRPAAFIDNDAWWTDPKSRSFIGSGGQTFESALFAVTFDNNFDGPITEFGFDVAAASVSNPVPMALNVGFFDTEDNRFSFQLDLAPNGDNPFLVGAGNFNTLNSPFLGREARYHFNVDELIDFGGIRPDDPNFDFVDYGIRFMDISLSTLTTNGGTTQFAIDNWTFNGSTPADPSREPILIQPIGSVPETTIYRFDYAGISASEENETNVDLSAFGSEDLANVSINTIPESTNIDAEDFTSSVVFFVDDVQSNGLQAHEVIHTLQNNGNETEAELGATTSVTPVTEGTSPVNPFAVEQQATPGDGTRGAVIDAAEAAGDLQQVFESISDILDQNHVRVLDVIQNIPLVSDESALFSLESLEAAGEYFLNYSLAEYIALKEDDGDPWRVGDQGVAYTPVLDESGEIVSYKVTTWYIADGQVELAQVVTIPEPTAAALFAMATLGSLARRRW